MMYWNIPYGFDEEGNEIGANVDFSEEYEEEPDYTYSTYDD